MLRGGRPLDVDGRTVSLVDDGVAAGSPLRAAIAALRGQGVGCPVVAVPTGHGRSMADLVDQVDALYCANVRHGLSFAVADAYQAWRDVAEEEVALALRAAQARTAAEGSRDGQ
jgi:putative phosphoribosyl transferase